MVSYQVDDSLQNSSVNTFFCYVLIASSCVFALLILRDFVKKAFGARQIDMSCGSGKRRTTVKLGLAIAKDVSQPKLFIKFTPEKGDEKQTVVIYDDLGNHIGKYGHFDIKVNQRHLRNTKFIQIGISSENSLRGEQIATLSSAKIVFPKASDKDDSKERLKDAIIYDPIELVNNIPVKLSLEEGKQSSIFFDGLYNSTSFSSFNWSRKVEEILIAMIVGFLYVRNLAYSSQSSKTEVVGLFGGAVKVDTHFIGYYHRIQDPWDTDAISLIVEAVIGGVFIGYFVSVLARFIHGFFLWLRPPVIISVETKCYTKKLFTKKRSGQNKRENVEDMFLLQNNPNMCAESFGRILGKLNKQSDMGELTYDWEIEMNGDFVEYTQIKTATTDGNAGAVFTTVYDDLADFDDFGELEEEDDNAINKTLRRLTTRKSNDKVVTSNDPEDGNTLNNIPVSAGGDPRVGKGFGMVSYFWIVVSLIFSGATISSLNAYLYTLLQTPKVDDEEDVHMGGLLISIWSCQIIWSLFISSILDDFVFRV